MGEFRSYGGFRFREVGRLRFEFPSRTNPSTFYICDIEDKSCSCWSHTKRSNPTGVCPHFRCLQSYFQKLAKVMSETNPEILKQQTK